MWFCAYEFRCPRSLEECIGSLETELQLMLGTKLWFSGECWPLSHILSSSSWIFFFISLWTSCWCSLWARSIWVNRLMVGMLCLIRQAVKSAVQTITVGGMSTSQFKTIIPLATAPNVQQIQVPGSKFHYVRLVTATTASSSAQPASQNPSVNTQPLQQGLWPCFFNSSECF